MDKILSSNYRKTLVGDKQGSKPGYSEDYTGKNVYFFLKKKGKWGWQDYGNRGNASSGFGFASSG